MRKLSGMAELHSAKKSASTGAHVALQLSGSWFSFVHWSAASRSQHAVSTWLTNDESTPLPHGGGGGGGGVPRQQARATAQSHQSGTPSRSISRPQS